MPAIVQRRRNHNMPHRYQAMRVSSGIQPGIAHTHCDVDLVLPAKIDHIIIAEVGMALHLQASCVKNCKIMSLLRFYLQDIALHCQQI